MKYKNKKRFEAVRLGIFLLLISFFFVSTTVFSFRHPWMTRTEISLHVLDALTWKRVSYKEHRKNYE